MRGLKSVARMVRYGIFGRIPYGMRGLKFGLGLTATPFPGRIPYGMRGLKCREPDIIADRIVSHPIRDAWIEIRMSV